MRSSKQRSRSKPSRPRTLGNIVNRVFDSSGPEGKVRGTPQQIIEKYLLLARDSQLSNDRVAYENFLQHAEHYTRMLGEATRELQREADERRDQQGTPPQNGQQRPSGTADGSQPRFRDDRDEDGQPEDRRDQPRYDQQRNDQQRNDQQRSDQQRNDQQRSDQPRIDQPRTDRPRDDQPRAERPREDRAKEDRAREDRAREDRAREDRRREQALAQPQVAAARPPERAADRIAEVIEIDDDRDTGLVETPEMKPEEKQAIKPPRRRPAPRKPKTDVALPDMPDAAATPDTQAAAPAALTVADLSDKAAE